MPAFLQTETHWTDFCLATTSHPEHSQRDRIMAALGLTRDCLPQVTDETLSRYYRFLSGELSFPFVTYYPEPTNPREQKEFRCIVLELLDPTTHLGDAFDGIFCKTRKGKYEINLPLTELAIPQHSPNSQLIDDYGYWFWHWR
jgi:hypothetical protein